jgi:hypothetical protein
VTCTASSFGARFKISATESQEFRYVAPVARALTFRSSPTANPVVKYDPRMWTRGASASG